MAEEGSHFPFDVCERKLREAVFFRKSTVVSLKNECLYLNRYDLSIMRMRTEKISVRSPEATAASGVFRAIFQGAIQKISFSPKHPLGRTVLYINALLRANAEKARHDLRVRCYFIESLIIIICIYYRNIFLVSTTPPIYPLSVLEKWGDMWYTEVTKHTSQPILDSCRLNGDHHERLFSQTKKPCL